MKRRTGFNRIKDAVKFASIVRSLGYSATIRRTQSIVYWVVWEKK